MQRLWRRRRNARTAPPPLQLNSIANLTIHFTTISTCVASTILTKQVWCSCTGFTCCRSERCPVSESWGSTDAGGSSARARTLCHRHTLPPSQIHHHCHRGFPVKVLQPRKPQKWMGFFCQICRYIVLTAAKEMSVGAITLILQGLFLLV